MSAFSFASTTANDFDSSDQLLTIIVPVFNEEGGLKNFHRLLSKALNNLVCEYEIIFINDGSSDQTKAVLAGIRARDLRVGVANLSRNFGKEAAMTAGLMLAKGDAVIIIDADLQDPPELIPEMVGAWQDGADVVVMKRRSRSGETPLKKMTAFAFFRFFNLISDMAMPPDVGDFRLLSRRTVNAINLLPERNRFMKGIFAWVGFDTTIIEYDRAPRDHGLTKLSLRKLWRFAMEGIISFSTVPLRLATYIGIICAFASFSYAAYFLFKTLIYGDPSHGFPTLIISVLLLGGLQLTATGILGEYVGRIFIESKRRPLYLIKDYSPSSVIPADLSDDYLEKPLSASALS